MNSYAIFRLPHAEHCTLIKGDAEVVPSLADISNEQGFLLAPFMPSDEDPILLIKGDVQEMTTPLPSHLSSLTSHLSSLISHFSSPLSPLTSYSADFATFHQALTEGRFQKLVLARCMALPAAARSPLQLFEEACRRYPRMCVSLVSTPQSGTWLTATPEILLEGNGHEWRTIALAGTMRLRNDRADNEGQHLRWSAKNIQEQRYVASYLADVLRCHADNIHEEGPRTVRAANLVHLRSDFTFSLNNKCTRVGELLQALHPTPAVCGLPKAEAQRFILANEHTSRHYYSGFMGTLNLSQSTHLYVSLRCMHITATACHLYAGGGLLRESIERQEWLETEAKMEAMRRLVMLDA